MDGDFGTSRRLAALNATEEDGETEGNPCNLWHHKVKAAWEICD